MSPAEIVIGSIVGLGVLVGLYVVGRLVWVVVSFRLHPERFIDEDSEGAASKAGDPAESCTRED